MAFRQLYFGYLDSASPSVGRARDAAIRKTNRAHGLPQTGRPSSALLEKLLATVRRYFLPPPKVSMVTPWGDVQSIY